MVAFDRGVFVKDFEARTRLRLRPAARAGLEFLLTRLEADIGFTQVRDLAYLLATVRWETGEAFQPLRERRARQDRDLQLWKAQNRYWPSGFYGRGYVQITWQRNYRDAGARLAGTTFSLDHGPLLVGASTFLEQPDLALDPGIAYVIAARGMREGWFTGKKLSDFITDGEPPDYFNARRIINRLDQAQRIADYASTFELVLRASAAPS